MNWAWAASLDQLWRSPTFPMWATLIAGVFFALVLLVTLLRAEKSMANGALAVITLLAIAVAVASGLRGFGDSNRTVVAGSQSIPQPMMTLPALSCLDGLAGDSVEAACERALFASADSAAAGVSYTANQISRLTALGDTVAASKVMTPELAALRRVIERDRYGFVAQVLLTREKCSPTACDMFRSLSNWRQVSANMAEGTYDGLVGRYTANWVSQPSVASTPSTALAGVPAVAPTGRPSTVEFPTAASIPPVNIMGTEPPAPSPAAPQAAAPAPRNPAPAAPPPAAAVQQPSPPPRQASTTTASSPPAAARKQPSPKQQRTTGPVQLAPPVEADDN